MQEELRQWEEGVLRDKGSLVMKILEGVRSWVLSFAFLAHSFDRPLRCLLYTRIGSNRGNPQIKIMYFTQSILPHSNGCVLCWGVAGGALPVVVCCVSCFVHVLSLIHI